MKRLFSKISKDFERLQYFSSYATDDAKIIVIAYGCVARAALAAVRQARENGMKAGLLTLKVLWPFMRRTVVGFLDKAEKALIPELNMGQVSREVKRVNQGKCQIATLNKVDGTLITPAEILKKLEEIA